MAEQLWIPIKRGAREDSASLKKVSKSGLEAVRAMAVDQLRRGSTRIVYEIGGVWKGTFQHGNDTFDTVTVPSAATISEEGAPEIPQEGIFVAVPSGATNIRVKVVKKKMRAMSGDWTIKPAPKPITEEEYVAGKEKYRPNREIYESDSDYPGKDFDFIGLRQLEGVTVAHIIIYLAQYKPRSSKLSVVETMTLEVSYDVPPQVDAAPKRLRGPSMLSDMILDIENVAPPNTEEFLDTDYPQNDHTMVEELVFAAPVDFLHIPRQHSVPRLRVDVAVLKRTDITSEYVIITTNALAAAVNPLVQAKSGWPHFARVATTETIRAEFPTATVKESIKAFLTWAWNNWAVQPRYVVLAGDTDAIPVHQWTIGGETYASDHYYADINGTLAPEIVVSRLPTSDATRMTQICQRLTQYVNQRGADWGGWENEVLLVAYEGDTYKQCSDQIAAAISPRYKVIKRYGDSSTRQQVIDEMNNAALFVNYRGHGSKTDWQSANGLRTADIRALTNQNRPPLVFCVCCQNAWVDDTNTETVVETFLREGKAVAVLGASRNSPTYANNDFNKYLFDAVVKTGEVMPGRIVQRAKTTMMLNHPTSTTHQQDVIMYMLFGDPTAYVSSTAEFLRGLWDMDHDGWKGVLNINRIWQHRVETSGNCGYPVWSFSGQYTQSGKNYPCTGKIGGRDPNDGNAGCKRSDHRVEFTIEFSPENNQRFVGYVTTWTRNVMCGYTWWANRPFGWYAKKR